MGKIASFDYIRTISVICIILCHCCFGIKGMDFMGQFLANTFNTIFLSLSAFLLGLSWQKKDYPKYGFSFITKRLRKLANTYYPFIVAMFIFLSYTGYNATIKDWLMHLLFLPWFDKLLGFGHLWFITMIMLCYIGIFAITRLPQSIVKKCKQGGIILLLISIFSQIIIGKIGLPNYIFIYLILYVYVFINAEKILSLIDRIPLRSSIFIGTGITIAIILLFYLRILNEYTAKWCGIIAAIVLFTIFVKLFRNTKRNVVVEYISTISFELYLVHHVFCFGKYSLYQIIPNPILGTIAVFAISFILATMLHYICNYIQRIPICKIGAKR